MLLQHGAASVKYLGEVEISLIVLVPILIIQNNDSNEVQIKKNHLLISRSILPCKFCSILYIDYNVHICHFTVCIIDDCWIWALLLKRHDLLFRSIQFIQTSITVLISECPDTVTYQIWYSWKKVDVLIQEICNPQPDDIPDNVPTCIDADYSNPEGTCSPTTALGCLARLEQEVFTETGTEDRFCV